LTYICEVEPDKIFVVSVNSLFGHEIPLFIWSHSVRHA
jgi:hypothetical protein